MVYNRQFRGHVTCPYQQPQRSRAIAISTHTHISATDLLLQSDIDGKSDGFDLLLYACANCNEIAVWNTFGVLSNQEVFVGVKVIVIRFEIVKTLH